MDSVAESSQGSNKIDSDVDYNMIGSVRQNFLFRSFNILDLGSATNLTKRFYLIDDRRIFSLRPSPNCKRNAGAEVQRKILL